jgi:hypothetical protein
VPLVEAPLASGVTATSANSEPVPYAVAGGGK